ncbi:MAG: hypothetical protein JST73_13395 [Actinobacteria bacterium]|nr:hypothetical protein [Actinomycetota bacterium]
MTEPFDLVDSSEVAEILGLSSNTSVSLYRRRYDDFPAPWITKGGGNCVLWHRGAIAEWAAAHAPTRRQPSTADPLVVDPMWRPIEGDEPESGSGPTLRRGNRRR